MENKNPQNIPADILKAIDSSDVFTKLEKIGDRYGLLIDQVGQLSMDTEGLMIGKIKSSDFVETVAKNLEISTQTAEKIAVDINTEIFSSLRESLRKMQEEAEKITPLQPPPTPPPPKPPINLLEKVEDFTVERRPPSNSPLYNDSALQKENVLNDLENIEKLKPQNANAFVEHLLSNPVSNPQQVEIKKQPVPPPIQRKSGIDPYREEV